MLRTPIHTGKYILAKCENGRVKYERVKDRKGNKKRPKTQNESPCLFAIEASLQANAKKYPVLDNVPVKKVFSNEMKHYTKRFLGDTGIDICHIIAISAFIDLGLINRMEKPREINSIIDDEFGQACFSDAKKDEERSIDVFNQFLRVQNYPNDSYAVIQRKCDIADQLIEHFNVAPNNLRPGHCKPNRTKIREHRDPDVSLLACDLYIETPTSYRLSNAANAFFGQTYSPLTLGEERKCMSSSVCSISTKSWYNDILSQQMHVWNKSGFTRFGEIKELYEEGPGYDDEITCAETKEHEIFHALMPFGRPDIFQAMQKITFDLSDLVLLYQVWTMNLGISLDGAMRAMIKSPAVFKLFAKNCLAFGSIMVTYGLTISDLLDWHQNNPPRLRHITAEVNELIVQDCKKHGYGDGDIIEPGRKKITLDNVDILVSGCKRIAPVVAISFFRANKVTESKESKAECVLTDKNIIESFKRSLFQMQSFL